MKAAARRMTMVVAAALAISLGWVAAAPAGTSCGDATDQERLELNRMSMGARAILDGCPFDVSASDSLDILRASVGATSCDGCVCDVDSSGAVSAVDSLIALYCSVGIHVPTMRCQPCS